MSLEPVFEFGEFQFDPAIPLLMRHSRAVEIAPKALEILTVLVKHAGQVVRKDDFLTLVWAENVVEEGNLAVYVSLLRRVLETRDQRGAFIETIPKVGYRFAAPIRVIARSRLSPPLPGASTILNPASAGRTVDSPIDSLAVMPFVSPDSDADYLADGITEDVINSLSGTPLLRVLPRSVVFAYKGRVLDPRAAGSDLGVRAILTGRILRHDDICIVQAELTDTRALSQIWGRRYERALADLQDVQEDITTQVAAILGVRLVEGDRTGSVRRPTENAEAYRVYLRGRYYWNRRTAPLLDKANQNFQDAIEKDHDFSLAYGALAQSYAVFSYYGVLSPEVTYREAVAAARRALALDENQVEAHVALAYAKMSYEWDWRSAEAHLRRALRTKPKDGTARQWYGAYLQACGQFEEGIAEYQRALDSEPLSLIFSVSLGHGYYFARSYDKALEELRSAIELDPGFIEAHLRLGWVLEQKGMLKEAIMELRHALNAAPCDPRLIGALGHAYALAGQRGSAQECLNQLKAYSRRRYVSPYDIAVIYAGLLEEDHVLASLERAAAERSFWVIWLKADPRFDLIRDSRRYRALTHDIFSKR